jgi:cytochrome c oxidase subunit 2
MARAKHLIIVALLIVATTLGLRFLFTFILALPVAASAEAGPIDTLFNAHFWMIAFLFALIMVFMVYSVFVFRRKPGDETDAPYVHGNTALEVSWTVVPTLVVIGFGLWGAAMLNDLIAPEPNEMTINVTGQQWSWSFTYPEQGDFGSGELVLPVNQPIVLQMEAEDVLHSFWVPEFRVKQDLVPGRVIPLRITPTLPGEYKVRCAEMCGLQHSTMLATVRVVSQEEFDAWVEEKLAVPLFGEMTPEERGAFWHSPEGFACAGCHSLDGTPGAGPTWQGLYGREEQLTDGTTVTADDEYIRSSIIDPNHQIVAGFNPNVMPQNYEQLFAAREAEIAAAEGIEIDIIADIIAFIQTLE